MVRLQTKNGQLAPSYTGPYEVVPKNRGNAYILKDHTGTLMPRNYTSVELKPISQDEVIELDDEGNEIKHYEIEAVLNHRGPPTKREYLRCRGDTVSFQVYQFAVGTGQLEAFGLELDTNVIELGVEVARTRRFSSRFQKLNR
ncbi:hypothetical protein BD770DRAFT_449717 [Pilaira anomala]|nr:hypothetical protein BD770DRAFT_449717 [Pilaira anomala]